MLGLYFSAVYRAGPGRTFFGPGRAGLDILGPCRALLQMDSWNFTVLTSEGILMRFLGSESVLHIPVVQLCSVVRRRVLLLRIVYHHCVMCVTRCPDLPDTLG